MVPPFCIVVGFDGSPDAQAALAWAARMSREMGARIRIVHAVGLLEHAGLGDRATVHRETALEIAALAGAEPANVEWSMVDGDPCSALLRMTTAPELADLLVVGSRGSDFHEGSLLGSTSLELAEHSPVPVTIVPAGYRSDRP